MYPTRSIIFLGSGIVLALIAISALVAFFIMNPSGDISNQQVATPDSDISQLESDTSDEQQVLIEARLQSDEVPELSAEQESLLNDRIQESADVSVDELSPEQEAIINERL